MKTRTYILILATVSILFHILVVAFAVTSIQGLMNSAYWVDTSIEKNNDMQAIRLSFEKVKRYSDILYFHVGVSERIDDFEKEISRDTDFIDKTINAYLEKSVVPQEYAMMNNLSELMSEHGNVIAQMIKSAKNNDKDEMEALLLPSVCFLR